ncbi:SDR family NAD(P)-dependent oxidoreductase [Aquimarina aquimarini]|uniref:SDR family NAD(P)-dependent oxidoreductase n=1 Tax=Aquimarina aquimarini TaxID=1191734 RepID=UPI001F453F03|nr:SDR family NAD(P)-dependent oxidoreductase [Aquimarina aquimarini]
MSDEKEYTTYNKKYRLNIPQMLSGGMSENWLLKELGDVHWNMISEALGSRSDQIIDSNGERLYASFVRLQWSMKSNCLTDFNENEEVQLIGDLSLYGNKIFFSDDVLSGKNKNISTSLMSVFSSRKSGNNQQLEKGKPLNVKEAKAYKHDKLPEFAVDFFKLKTILFPTTKNNKENDQQQFQVLDSEFSLEQDCGFSKSYIIDPYDDINGVGLLYFASYPKISDKCERFYFQDNYQRIDNEIFNWAEIGSCIARDIHYYGNANVNDELLYVLELYTIIKESNTIKIVSSLYRKKDKKLIAKIFTIKKIAFPIIKKSIDKEQESSKFVNDKNVKSQKIQQSKKSFDILLIEFFSKMFPDLKFSKNTDLRPLGIESITFLELSEYLNVTHGLSTNPSDFYGLYTIDQISYHFIKEEGSAAPIPVLSKQNLSASKKRNELNDSETSEVNQDDIAIIGLAFKLPGGIETKEAFWDILKEGKQVIQELPKDRWKWAENIQVDGEHQGINMGGFIRNVMSFDANFFKISPRVAEIMDPQQRKLLEVCWHCLEDSGITNDKLKGSNTGVFVGASGSDYSRYIGDEETMAHAGIGTSASVLANRISHFFDLKGPSIQLDTACSSSLVALHQAINSIKNKECEQAIVSGVNIMLHPFNTQVYYKAGMLNKDGLCKTFDKDAGGYVRGEGIISLIIKPLSKALKDNDTPYALIKGSAINHGGNAGGITVPNPNQQSALIEKALSNAKVDVKDVSFIEAHGTGTKLGDPIEINGLNKVFQKITNPKNNCLIGSVKTNIGHLEAAAGLAGLVKVLLSFENESIPPIANFKELNPHINLSDSTLRINQDLRKWDTPDAGNRIAGISSFGSGGTNAHVIVEQIPTISQPKVTTSDHYIICISGDTDKALNRNIQQLLQWINKQKKVDLLSVSYNLLARRTHLLYRAAFIVSNVEDLKNVLNNNRSITSEPEKGYYSTDYEQTNSQPLFVEWFENYLNEIKKYSDVEQTQLEGLAELFVRGSSISWGKLFKTLKFNRESLPFYQFEKSFFSILSNTVTSKSEKVQNDFVYINESQYNLQRFISNFSGKEYFFKEHRLKETPILPGVVYLEMIRYALYKSFPNVSGFIKMEQINWKIPIVANNAQEIHTELRLDENKIIKCSITNKSKNQENFSGEVSLIQSLITNKRNIKVIQSQCTTEVGSETIYNILKKNGYNYGNTFRTVTNLYLGENMALGVLKSKKSGNSQLQQLEIGILDGALQASMYTFFFSKKDFQMVYPFFVESFALNTQLLDLNQNIYVYTYKQENQIQIELLDEQGNVVYKFDNIIFKSQQNVIDKGIKLYTPKRNVLSRPTVKKSIKNRIIIGYGGKEFQKQLNSLSTADKINTQIITLDKEQDIEGFNSVIKSLVVLLKKMIENYKDEITLFFLLEKEKGINYSNGISGVLNCLCQEYDRISFQLVEIENVGGTYSEMIEVLTDNFYRSEKRIIWDRGTRYGFTWNETNHDPQLPWKDKGVYLITGGSGGIGKHLAEEIASKAVSPTIILIGRSSYNKIKKKQVANLIQLGAHVEYKSLDICDNKQLSRLRNYILSQFGQIDGIIHTAGVQLDELLIQVKEDSLGKVLNPKVKGTINLDTVFIEEKIDFMILFSSVIPIIGNIGQISYAAANGFIDDFSNYRNQLVNKKERFGKTIAINWPYWIDGGMKMPVSIQNEIKDIYGLVPLRTDQALKSIYNILSGDENQIMVTTGNQEKILSMINGVTTPVIQSREESRDTLEKPIQSEEPILVPVYNSSQNRITKTEIDNNINSKQDRIQPSMKNDNKEIKQRIVVYFKELMAGILKLDASEIDEKSSMEKYGIDSIMIMELTHKLEKVYGKLPKTLFFEYKRIWELVDYFIKKHRDKTLSLIGIERKEVPKHKIDVDRNLEIQSEEKTVSLSEQKGKNQLDIAIIGISGKYPKAENLEKFWENLVQGRDCVTEIPKDRWDHSKYYDAQKGIKGKTYSKWGGFIDDVACFDPLFFGITPLEAEYMDPQERLFLECAYATLEDAGYTRERLKSDLDYESGPNIGVFAGVMYEEYQLYGAQLSQMGEVRALGGSPASIANRVSHYFDFHGPSMGVDTMCSSALTAIDLACKSLLNEDCEAALAGAVNTSLHPNKYIMLSQGNFVSSKGKCESFGIGGEGYVPSEGVGIVMLKRLDKAVADGDQIYGVIKSSAINHGGKTNGYTVPNPQAQASVIKKAIKKAGIDPEDISYVEAHGTGTALGDPIEIAGLNRAFENRTTPCPIGSVKSNIGHCESAAGISGLTKIILQLKYKKLVPSLHSETLNPNIDFSDTLFYVQQQQEEWLAPSKEINGEVIQIPRIAAISSFGAGGSNAHMIIQEYRKPTPVTTESFEHPILISAKTKDQLIKKASDLVAFVQKRKEEIRLADIAFTLQIGKEPMKYKVGFIASSLTVLVNKLNDIVESNEKDDIWYNQSNQKRKVELNQEDIHDTLEKPLITTEIISYWLEDRNINWTSLLSNKSSKIISLPTYPFFKEKYWPNLDVLKKGKITESTNDKIKETVWVQKVWKEDKVTIPDNPKTLSNICIITTPETYELATILNNEIESGEIIQISNIQDIRESKLNEIQKIIDLTPLSEKESIGIQIIPFLQRIITLKKKSFSVIGVFKEPAHGNGDLMALYKTLGLEYHSVEARYLLFENNELDVETKSKWILNEIKGTYKTQEVKIGKGIRQTPRLKEVIPDFKQSSLSFDTTKVVWVTGGTRGIGYTCVEYLVEKYNIKKLVLTGKTQFPPEKEWDKLEDPNWIEKISNIKKLQQKGVAVHVNAINVSDPKALEKEVLYINSSLGSIGTVIHAAGIADFETPAFVKKEENTIKEVLQPKKEGTKTLLESISNQPIDKVILFSSVSALIPSLAVGQIDYAMANSNLDLIAEQHNYPFDIISVQWPNWKDSGMGEVKSRSYQNTGIISLSDQEGLSLLEDILKLPTSQVIMPAIIKKEQWNPEQLLNTTKKKSPVWRSEKKQNTSFSNRVETNVNVVEEWLVNLFSTELRIPKNRLEKDMDFSDFGVDSIILTQLMQSVNKYLETDIDPSIFYEYASINRLVYWINENHKDKFVDYSECENQQISDKKEVTVSQENTVPNVKSSSVEYAIIGMSCRFPNSKNIHEFWDFLAAGETAIKRVPASRWGNDDDGYAALLDSIEEFDAAHFLITPEDAASMDPQALLILEETLHLIYQAGYTKEEIKRTSTGVYIGARSRHNPDKNILRQSKNPIMALGQNYLATNVSQYFDLGGPSLVVDTACSSAVTAMDIACKDLNNGDIHQAIIGGVHLLQTQEAQQIFRQRNLLNETGEFHVFDKKANGVILGEGIGMIMIKRLEDALKDGDKIEAVISGIAINNDGRTSGHATPNLEAQKAVMKKALNKAGMQSEEITHIETNGSGTELTDLLELKAIKSVYPGNIETPRSLGSIKPNIGHPLCAEGIAGVIKLALMLKYRSKVPFISGQRGMKHFDIKKEGYQLDRKKKLWGEGILKGVLNCFADGGTNAHLILRSAQKEELHFQKKKEQKPPELIPYPITSRDENPHRSEIKPLHKKELKIKNFWKETAIYN